MNRLLLLRRVYSTFLLSMFCVLAFAQGKQITGVIKEREFDIKSKDSKLPVIDKVYINGGFLLKKAVCCNS